MLYIIHHNPKSDEIKQQFKNMTREQIIREVANYLRPYDAKAADLALECISSNETLEIIPDAILKYLCESIEYAKLVHDDIKRVSVYGGSAFIIFNDDTTYKISFQSYNNEVCADSAQPQEAREEYNAGLICERILCKDEIETLKKKLQKEEQDHYYTRCAWEQTSLQLQKFKNKDK